MTYTLITYIFLNFFVLYLFSKISYKLNLVDIPNKRKIHIKETAYTGGTAISVILLFAIMLFDNFSETLSLTLSIAFLISIVGLIDDKFHLNTGGKLSLQIIPLFYLVFFENLTLSHIGDYDYFKIELGTLAIPFTFLSLLFLINSFNYFDGMDGTLSFTSISVLIILLFLAPNQNIKFFIIILLITIIIFLFFNFSIFNLPKLFLGDSGSLLLGFIISFILIFLANQNFVHPILLAWSIVIFVYEFLSINLIRLKNNQNPFKAGLDHLHHILFDKTRSIFITNIFIFFVNILFFLIGYLSYSLINPLSSLILFILLFIPFLIFRNIFSGTLKKRIN